MGAAISNDLRMRAVRAYLAGEGTFAELAELFAVGEASLRRWVKRSATRARCRRCHMGAAG